jgi:hypothetical protein
VVDPPDPDLVDCSGGADTGGLTDPPDPDLVDCSGGGTDFPVVGTDFPVVGAGDTPGTCSDSNLPSNLRLDSCMCLILL